MLAYQDSMRLGSLQEWYPEDDVVAHSKAGKEHDGNPVTIRDEDFEPGRVKFVHRDGYGFITREGKPDVYFHVARVPADVANELRENTAVLVAVGDSKRGPSALMMKIDDAN